MGFMDKLGDMFGSTKTSATDSTKGPSQTLKENGIDPSNLKFKFNPDSTVGISGPVADQATCDRICEIVAAIPTVTGVQNNLVIDVPEPQAIPEPEPEIEVVSEEVSTSELEETGRTYTVQSGDTLWKIAEKMYGSGGKYMKIFEANTSLLENPDKIFPGQELVIPDLSE